MTDDGVVEWAFSSNATVTASSASPGLAGKDIELGPL